MTKTLTMDGAEKAGGLARKIGSAGMATVLAVALLSLLAALYVAYFILAYPGDTPLYEGGGLLVGRDFVAFWTASDLVLEGKVSELADPEVFKDHYETRVGPVSLDPELAAEHSYPWYYPPVTLLFVAPLALLPYLWSYALWMALTVSGYLLAAARRGMARVDVAALLLAPATMTNFLIGQNGFLSAALLIGGLRLVESRPWLAGVLIGLLSYKPHLGLLVPVALIAGRHWRAFAAASATVMTMLVASILFFGLESWSDFLGAGATLPSLLLNEPGGGSRDLAIAPVMVARNLGLDPITRNLLYALLAAFAVWGVFTTYRNPRAEAELRIPVLLAGVILASPYGLSYDLPLVSVAVLWCFQHGLRRGFVTGEVSVLGLVWLLPFLAMALNPQDLPPGPLALAAFFGLVLAKANGWVGRPGRLPSQGLPASPG